MKRILILILVLAILTSGCGLLAPENTQCNTTYLDLFDTVTTIVGYADSQAEFTIGAKAVHDELLAYHRLFDIYHEYDGLNNLKTVNDQAGIAPVTVDPVVIDFLLDCRAYYNLTGGRVNVAMGSVLKLWHESRNAGLEDPDNASLPDAEMLEQAAAFTDFDRVVIDPEASTVYLPDSEMALDVGAIAKGWASQRAADNAPAGMLISVGGNVCITGPKNEQGDPWIVGVQDPDGGATLHTIAVPDGSVVTSGDYQRVYVVDGKSYHHIIDPDTRMPGEYWRSVTVVCTDSGLADALSTALFLLPLEEGMALAQQCGAEALWVDAAGEENMTPGFEAMICEK